MERRGECKKPMNKQTTIGLSAGFFLVAAFVFALNAAYGSTQHDKGCETVQCRRDLAAARAGTAAYHDLQTAMDDQFIEPFNPNQCFTLPEAGMGFHYVKPSRVADVTPVAAEPELLVYMPDDKGVQHLVAVEYLVPGSPTDTPPELFGQQFHFTPLVSGWTLHAWIWRENPAGMFEDFNPKLRCPAA
jgi:hypothetical protein